MFNGFTDDTIKFFMDIRYHNDAETFKALNEIYQNEVKAKFSELINDLAPTMTNIDSTIELRPSKCLARIRRDTRFTKDKTPYRDHLWMLFRKSGEPRDGSPFFWYELSPETSTCGVGIWGQPRQFYEYFRSEMVRRPQDLQRILKSLFTPKNDFVLNGDCYKRRKIPGSLPLELQPFYIRKQIYISHSLDDYSKVFTPKLTDILTADFKTLAPMYLYMRKLKDKFGAEI